MPLSGTRSQCQRTLATMPSKRAFQPLEPGGASLQADGNNNHKTTLTPSYFSTDHFSSSLADKQDYSTLKRTRVAVKLLEGKDLLVSDLPTGTSDPVALVWVGQANEGGIDYLQKDLRGVQSTEVRKHTVDPVWDADFVFPLEVQSVDDVLHGQINIVVRDHGDTDGDVHYLDLGRVSVSLGTVLIEGNIMPRMRLVQLPARWFTLQPCRGMKRSRGALKVAIGFFFGTDSSVLLVDSDESVGQGMNAAARFEQGIRKIREKQSSTATGHWRGVSMSPTRRSQCTSRTLTARGGTTSRRPKSAPQVTTLYSPRLPRQRPFKLKSLHPRLPAEEGQSLATTPLDVKREVEDDNQPRLTEAFEGVRSSRWQDTIRPPAQQHTPRTPPPLSWRRSDRADVSSRIVRPLADLSKTYPPATQPVRSSNRLSRLAAKAASGFAPGPPNISSNRDRSKEATLRVHLWHRALLESIQRLEDRGTEGLAYGELRAMARDASPTQVGQIVTAARGVGAGCSLAARRYTLRLLAWLCWDQLRAVSKFIGSMVSYVMDRTRDEETVSLRGELVTCVGAIMLSGLRTNTADVSMALMRRFLEAVRQQRKSVRESAGACCVASISPKPPGVPVEIETGLRGIDDVRIAIAQAAGRAGITIALPKEVVLLPGGRLIVELANASDAAEFYHRLSSLAGALPSAWSIYPFPEEFCADVKGTAAAHFVRLTVNSEEILASLLHALDSNRSEGTRGQVLNAIAAMAWSVSDKMDEPETPHDGVPTTNERCQGMSATLKKGLPAVVRSVTTVMECNERRAYTWKERKAALEVVIVFSGLRDLCGQGDRPLEEYRSRLIQGSLRCKRDSVAAVRETAVRALVVLEATDAEQSRRGKSTDDITTGVCASGVVRGFGAGTNGVITSTRRRYDGRVKLFPTHSQMRHKFDEIVAKAEGVMTKEGTSSVHAKSARTNGHGDYRGIIPDICAKSHGQESADTATDNLSQVSEDNPSSSVQSPRRHSRISKELQLQDFSPCPVKTSGTSPLFVENRDIVLDGYQAGTSDVQPSPPPEEVLQLDTSPKSCEDEKIIYRKPEEPLVGDLQTDPDENAADPARPREGTDGVISASALVAQSEPRNVSVQTIITPKSPPFDVVTSPVEHPIRHVSLQSAARMAEDAVLSMPYAPGGRVASPSSPSLGGLKAHIDRLLRKLYEKTDGVATVLNSLDQRLVGMEKHLTEPPPVVASPSHPASTKLNVPRSVKTSESREAAGKTVESKDKVSTTASLRVPASGTRDNSTQALVRLRGELEHMVARDDIEEAFRLVLTSGEEHDALRLMGTARGPTQCLGRLGSKTRDRLFVFIARTMLSGRYTDHVLPWVFELVKAGEARALPVAVRMQLAGALHGLATNPTDQGVMTPRG